MSPQAAPHKRGGTHRVKDGDKTNTVYDEWNYMQLKSGCIERKLYVKDMRKVEMARALAQNDIDKKRVEREAMAEYERRQKKLKLEKENEQEQRLKETAAKLGKREEKKARRERDESVSDDTPDEDEMQMMYDMMIESVDDNGPVGQALSECSWDSSSTEEESDGGSIILDINPSRWLRVYEWNFLEPPSPTPRTPPPQKRVGNEWVPCSTLLKQPPPVPRAIPYCPLKVLTSYTEEKLFFPGLMYPPNIDPQYVPILPHQTRHAARNGILEGLLQNAIIERATDWADRTQVQGWNGRMYFSVAKPSIAKNLQEVYRKWDMENRKLLRVKPVSKITRDQRHLHRYKNKAKKQMEVYEAYQPPAICYVPAYLDWNQEYVTASWSDVEKELDNDHRSIKNLFFIRFHKSCDVPHYYFWAKERAWADPTKPNPDWTPEMAEREKERVKDHAQFSGKRLPSAPPKIERTRLVHVKDPGSGPLTPPEPTTALSDLENLVELVEYELYNHGLSKTLTKYRKKWLEEGKQDAWNRFGQNLPFLYPSGVFPTSPPVEPPNETTIATKLASIELYGYETNLPPLQGDEPWTESDDLWWDLDSVFVDVDEHEGLFPPAETVPTPIHSPKDAEMADAEDLDALYRRDSIPEFTMPKLSKLVPAMSGPEECTTWLDTISPSFEPLTPSTLPASPVFLTEVDFRVRH
ncbi:hypothetical protein ACEQ8H_007151 [Pleosporales sp. CAS-2024a]